MHLSLQIYLTSILIYGSLLITASPLSSTKIKSSSKVKSYSLPLSHIRKSSTPLTGDALLASLKSNMARVKVKYAANDNLKSTMKSKTASKKVVVVTSALAQPITKSTKKQVVVIKPVIKNLSGKKIVKVTVVNSKKIKSRASGEQTLVDIYHDYGYSTVIQIGTPPISYNVSIDTGSFQLVMIGSKYTPEISSSSRDLNIPWSAGYTGGSNVGELFSDQISFAGVSGNLEFGVANSTSSLFLPKEVSGLLGLGHINPKYGDRVPFLQKGFMDGKLDLPLFAISLGRWRSVPSPTSGGLISVGSLDSTLYKGPISYVPTVLDQWMWFIPLAAVHLNLVDINLSAPACTIDSGTTLIYLPKASAIALYANIPGSYEVGGGLFGFPCKSVPILEFTFGTTRWTVSQDDFNFGVTSNSTMCFGAVAYFDDNWCIIGDAFMKNVYSVFSFSSPPSVGFAQLTGPGATTQQITNSFVISIVDLSTKKQSGYLQKRYTSYGALAPTTNLSSAMVILPMKSLSLKVPINLVTSSAVGKSNTYLGISPGLLGVALFKASQWASVVLTRTSGAGKDGIFDQSSDSTEVGSSKGTSKVWIVGDFDAVQKGYPLSLSFPQNSQAITCAQFFINKKDNPGTIDASCSTTNPDFSNKVLLYLTPI